MSVVKRKLTNKSLKDKCEIICHIVKGMANKKASKKFGVPKNIIPARIKNKEKRFSVLREKKLHGCNYKEVEKAVVCDCFIS